jgi:hypothetical protein
MIEWFTHLQHGAVRTRSAECSSISSSKSGCWRQQNYAGAIIPEQSPVGIAPKGRSAASKMTHQKSAPVKRGKR